MGLPLTAAVGEARLDVVKINVEGAEGRAMAGMWDVIACWKPVVFSEFTPDSMPTISGMSARDYLRMFASLGYRISVLDKCMGLINSGSNAAMVTKAFELATDSHLDLMFEHPSR